MAKDMRTCEYHGKFEAGEWNDWQCPKCEKEIMAFGRFAGKGYNEKDLTADAKNIMKRMGVKF